MAKNCVISVNRSPCTYYRQTDNVETMMVLTMVTLCPRLSLATPSWFSATGTEQESFLDTCSIIIVT